MLNCMHEIGLTCLLPNKISAVHCIGINQHCILDNSLKRPALLSPNTTWILQHPKRRRCVFRCFCHSKSISGYPCHWPWAVNTSGDFVLHEWNAFLTSVSRKGSRSMSAAKTAFCVWGSVLCVMTPFEMRAPSRSIFYPVMLLLVWVPKLAGETTGLTFCLHFRKQ